MKLLKPPPTKYLKTWLIPGALALTLFVLVAWGEALRLPLNRQLHLSRQRIQANPADQASLGGRSLPTLWLPPKKRSLTEST